MNTHLVQGPQRSIIVRGLDDEWSAEDALKSSVEVRLTSAFAENSLSQTSTDGILSDIAMTSAFNQLLTHTGPSVSPSSQVLFSTVHGPAPGYGSDLARKIWHCPNPGGQHLIWRMVWSQVRHGTAAIGIHAFR